MFKLAQRYIRKTILGPVPVDQLKPYSDSYTNNNRLSGRASRRLVIIDIRHDQNCTVWKVGCVAQFPSWGQATTILIGTLMSIHLVRMEVARRWVGVLLTNNTREARFMERTSKRLIYSSRGGLASQKIV